MDFHDTPTKKKIILFERILALDSHEHNVSTKSFSIKESELTSTLLPTLPQSI